MRILLDEMFPPVIAEQLRARGHDVVAVLERDDLRGVDDPEVFEAAQAERRAIVTENVPDYVRLDRASRDVGRDHHGLVFARKAGRSGGHLVGRLVSDLDAFLAAHPSGAARSLVTWL